ncbi:Palmitoyltransferase, DHHC domain [Dillenia turbinata]|uniref:S-acyltransferase n=1 Tax=Dillenia turbinata TaxID=194707 RepID=A0AAN8UTI0_9MAGN
MGPKSKDSEIHNLNNSTESESHYGHTEIDVDKLENETESSDPKEEKIQISVRERFVWIKRACCFHHGHAERTRAYHVWPANNVFFFGGRLICGPDPRGLLLTTFSISLSSWVFAVYIGHSALMITFSLILTALVFVNLFLVSTIDPGIIPRNVQASIEEEEEQEGNNDQTRSMRIIVNGVELKQKYCRICKIFRPPRSCHCAICDNCIENFDHHCPWTSQCIGLRNYRFYMTFIFSAIALYTYIFAFSCRRIQKIIWEDENGFLGALSNCPETLAVAAFSVTAIAFLGGLGCYHLYLIAKNQTAYEYFRQRFADSGNPFDKGVFKNFKEVFFMPLPPSRIDLTRILDE